jgi:hypothetical protein
MQKNDIIEVKAQQVQHAQPAGISLVTRQDVEAMKAQRELLKEFVGSQLVEAKFDDARSASYGEGDYGVIPGTKKRCLFKQGAEKLQRLFRLGCRFRATMQEVDKAANFAMFTYRCEIYLLETGMTIAECEGSANSQEDKYRERTVWKKNSKGVSESTKEETPIFNVLNTLQKMAQKRAMIGATILATGASEYFTQDVLEPEEVAKGGATPPPAAAQPEQPAAPAGEVAPECCGRPMMVSKYADKETGPVPPFYCVKCKAKVARAA